MMSLNETDTQALGSLEHGLAGTDPRLASMLNIFSRLAAGEEMPAGEKIRVRRGRPAGHRPRRARRYPRRRTALPQLAYSPSHLEQPQRYFNLRKTRSPTPAAPHPPGLRSEMDSISDEYAVDQAATGSAQSEPVVSVRGLVKRYGSHEAVAGIDLEVRRGEIFAFLGPNGAGKRRLGFQETLV